MNPIDVIIIVAASLTVVGVIGYSLWKKKKGITGCGCGCANCPSRGACGSQEKKDA